MRMPETHLSLAPAATSATNLELGVWPGKPVAKAGLKPRKSHEWSTFETFLHESTTLRLALDWTPRVEGTMIELPETSPLEDTISLLLRDGKVTEDFAVDLFKQKAIYETREQELKREYAGKEVVISGEKVFFDESFEGALTKAKREFPNRPYYSVSFAESPISF